MPLTCADLSLLKGDVSIGIKCAPGVVGPAEADINFDIIRNDNDTFTVKYTPQGAGSYTILVLFADQVRPFLRGNHCKIARCGRVTWRLFPFFICFLLISRPPPPAPSESKWNPRMMPAKSKLRDLASTGLVSWGYALQEVVHYKIGAGTIEVVCGTPDPTTCRRKRTQPY